MHSVDMDCVAFWSYDPSTKKVEFIFETEVARRTRDQIKVLGEVEGIQAFLPFVVEEDREKFLNLYKKFDEGADFVEEEIRAQSQGEQNIRYFLIRMKRSNISNLAYCFAIDTTVRAIQRHRYEHAYQDFLQLSPEAIKIVHLNLTQNLNYPILGGKNLNEFRKSYRLPRKFSNADEYFQTLLERIEDPNVRLTYESILTREHMIEEFRNGNEKFELEYMFRMKDGSDRWLKTRIQMIQNPEEYDIEAFVTTSDIDKHRKLMQISWLVPHKEFDFIGLIDLKKSTIEFFHTAEKSVYNTMRQIADLDYAHDFTRDNLISPEYRDIFDRETQIENIIEQIDQYGNFAVAYKIIDKNSQSARLLRCYWLDSSRDYIVIVQSNVSNLFEREREEFKNAQMEITAAEKANKIRSEFVSRITHDIRTPISLVSSMIDFAFKDIDNRHKLVEDLKKIRSTGKLLLSLVNDVLDISKIESGKIVLQPASCNLNDIIADIRNIFEPQCQQKNIEFNIYTVGEENFESLIVDRVRLTQILMNIVSNAIKYSLKGGRVDISICAEVESEEICSIQFIISDDGIGMSENFQQKMFMPFEQDYENPLRDPKIVSTGLGLPIVKNLVELMGGKIQVDSEFGHGTTFTIDLEFPIAKKIDEKAHAEEKRVENLKEALRGRKILFVEDNELNAEIGQRILEMFGLICICVSNGALALKRFQESNPGEFDAILMDLQMPVLDGFQATELIRALKRSDADKIPIIAMTADAFDETTDAILKSGMNAHLTKPIEPDKLLDVLAQFIG